MTSKNIINNALAHEKQFFADIGEILRAGRDTAYRSVNSVMVKTYWQIGRRIVEQEQRGQERANYGEYLIVNLSRYLTDCLGKGFSVANLKNIRQFYQVVPSLDELATQCVANLSWSHIRLIMRIDSRDERHYYFKETGERNWSVRQLERNIKSGYYRQFYCASNARQQRRNDC